MSFDLHILIRVSTENVPLLLRSMRAAGERTPDIAMWQRLPSGRALSSLNLKKYSFPKILQLYNAPCATPCLVHACCGAAEF